MRLSEAIRAGAKMSPKIMGKFSTPAGTCALGAAGESCGIIKHGENISSFFNFLGGLTPLFPIVDTTVDHPLDGHRFKVADCIWDLNDNAEWSREAIAEWADPHPELHVAMPTQQEAVRV